MNARIIAFIACRLFAVYLFVMYVLNFTLMAVFAFVTGQSEAGLTYGGVFFAPVFSAMIAAVLWFGAGWISNRVAGSLPEAGSEGISLVQWRAMVVAAIGVLFVMKGADLCNEALKILVPQAPSPESTFLPLLAISSVVYALVGIALIAGPRLIIEGFKGVQSWLTKPAFTREDQ